MAATKGLLASVTKEEGELFEEKMMLEDDTGDTTCGWNRKALVVSGGKKWKQQKVQG
jgi:hypothetical protein